MMTELNPEVHDHIQKNIPDVQSHVESVGEHWTRRCLIAGTINPKVENSIVTGLGKENVLLFISDEVYDAWKKLHQTDEGFDGDRRAAWRAICEPAIVGRNQVKVAHVTGNDATNIELNASIECLKAAIVQSELKNLPKEDLNSLALTFMPSLSAMTNNMTTVILHFDHT